MSEFDDLLRELEDDHNNTRVSDHKIDQDQSIVNFNLSNQKQQKNNQVNSSNNHYQDPQFSMILERNNRHSNMLNDLLRELDFEGASILQEKKLTNKNNKKPKFNKQDHSIINHNNISKTKLGDLSLYLKDLNITRDNENLNNLNNTILNKQSILNPNTTKDFLLELERSKFVDNLHSNQNNNNKIDNHNNIQNQSQINIPSNKQKGNLNNHYNNHDLNESQACDIDIDFLIKEMNEEIERKQLELTSKLQNNNVSNNTDLVNQGPDRFNSNSNQQNLDDSNSIQNKNRKQSNDINNNYFGENFDD